MVRVSDVANVGWAESEQLHLARFDDHRALFVTIRQKDDADAGTLHDALIPPGRSKSRRTAAGHASCRGVRSGHRYRSEARRAWPRFRNRSWVGAGDADPARAAPCGGCNVLDSSITSDGHIGAATARIFAQPSEHRRVHHFTWSAGRRFSRGGGKYRTATARRRLRDRVGNCRQPRDQCGDHRRNSGTPGRLRAPGGIARSCGRFRTTSAEGCDRDGCQFATGFAHGHSLCRQSGASPAPW